MRTIVTLFCLAACLMAQSAPSLQVAIPAVLQPGKSSTVSVILNNPTGNLVATQFTIALPASWVWGTPAPGSAAISSGKTVACSRSTNICLVYQINTTILGSGQIASIPFTIPASQPAATSIPITLSNPIAADASGTNLAITATSSSTSISTGPITTKAEDLNGDGKVDALDVAAAVNQALGFALCVDIDSNGKCDILDVLRVIKAALEAGTPPAIR